MSYPVRPVSQIARSVSITHKKTKPELIFLNTSDIERGQFLHRNYTDPRSWPGQAKKSIAEGDTLFSEIRPGNGRWAFVDFDAEDYVVSTKLMVIRVDHSVVVPKFFYLWVSSPNVVDRLQSLAESRSGTFPQITFDDLGFLDFPTPDLTTQLGIVNSVAAIDDKIALNRKTAATLEAMARALYQSWFVNFDPVHAKAEGRALGHMPAETAALFPDRFGDDGLPEGWFVEPLIDQALWVNGAAYKNMHFSSDPDALPVIKIAELKAGITSSTKFTTTDLGERFRISRGELLFSWSGNPDTSIDAFIWPLSEAWLNQHIFAVREKGRMSRGALFCALRFYKPELVEIARNKQTIGLGHITRKDLESFPVAMPPEPVEAAFEAQVSPLFERYCACLYENQTLAALRDTLLPRLMSGELRVGEAREQVEAVA
ncbi:MAG: restriction endonuclease subunit S [Sulfitobacter sp.]